MNVEKSVRAKTGDPARTRVRHLPRQGGLRSGALGIAATWLFAFLLPADAGAQSPADLYGTMADARATEPEK